MDDIFCIFQGHIGNLANLKQQYGLNKTANEAIIVIEAYRTLRDRGPYPVDQVVRDFQGKFAFVLYDSISKAVFLAVVSNISFLNGHTRKFQRSAVVFLLLPFSLYMANINLSFAGFRWKCSCLLGN